MTEWYVITEGFGSNWTPIRVVLGRLDALNEFTKGYKVTADEHKKLGRFLEGGVCDLGSGLHLVGFEDRNGDRVLDRKLTRIIGPGTEV